MYVSDGLRRLLAALETLEANDLTVDRVETLDTGATDGLTVGLTVTVPRDGKGSTDGRGPAASSDAGPSPGDRTERESPDESRPVRRDDVLDPLRASAIVRTRRDGGDARGDERVDHARPRGTTDIGPSQTDDADRPVRCPVEGCDATFESDHGMKIHRTKVHRHGDGAADRVPAYRDPERLRAVYESCDSFTEMRAALGTDVSAQTVRRQMIAKGIYRPETARPGSRAATDGGEPEASAHGDGSTEPDDEATEPDPEASDARAPDETTDPDAAEDASDGAVDVDGIDDGRDGSGEEAKGTAIGADAIALPEDVTVGDLKDAVADAKTPYDVQRRFDLRREDAIELLERYDLLDLVHGRVSHHDRRKRVDPDEITSRILACASVSRASGT